ncbi:Transcription initiation factor TFIID 23-30kDa subunit [Penicillium soppii]|uniref:Transcription initiation factor TFIID 23-30kDa subunit n=1 Tax=Penicillium soppii TaxID=69789 RepID=UPI00254775F3|nr:Transcription initiation factor TFIID 23-30kDa subunit [Penicillium soppii]KAJ5875804.1 Transcription initiation factor TFIID 23-30kDa subunit [Penicillium soppii]
MTDSQTSQPPQPPQNGSEKPSEETIKTEPDLDASIEQDVEMNPDPQNTDDAPGIDPMAPAPTPSKKETSLREFLGKMDDYAPIIPDAVTAHYLTLAGLPPPGTGPGQTPLHLARLLALAAQKFVSDIAADSYQYARIRASNSSSANNPIGSLAAASGLNAPAGPPVPGEKGKAATHLGIQRPGFGGGGSGGSGQGRTVLTMEDLGMAVGEYGVSVKRGEFYR